MAGIYIHIPFCKQACSYCDFHFSTSLRYKVDMIAAICKEIHLATSFIQEPIQTIYFGGGTPSLLSATEINQITEAIYNHYPVNDLLECTLEANPDDLNPAYLKSLKGTIIDRLSIGVQSFQSEDLKMMNRAHTANEAEYAIKQAQDIGFERLSCDLIFGTPTLSHLQLKENIQRLASYAVDHISAYALTIEERTALAHKLATGAFTAATDEHYVEQMIITMDTLQSHGYEQYEISNYARHEAYAVHNTNYWKGVGYLGVGPSAHSYTGNIRRWNVRNNVQYIQSIMNGILPYEEEQLSLHDQYNEYVMTSLRTKWGIDTAHLNIQFGSDFLQYLEHHIAPFMAAGQLQLQGNQYTLTDAGKLVADAISATLFFTES